MEIAPAAHDQASPAVGIFGRVDGVLVIDRSTLQEAEPYGDFLTFTHPAGHYERWEAWRAFGPGRLIALGYPGCIASTEYDQWPRGRIVYDTTARRFILDRDRRPQKAADRDCRSKICIRLKRRRCCR